MIHPFLLPYIALLFGQVDELPVPARCNPVVTSIDGNDLLVLINKSTDHQLDESWEPDDLVPLHAKYMVHGHRGLLRAEAAAALSTMLSTARKDRRRIRVRSSYRSYKTQKKVFRSKVRKYGERKARNLSAEAGHSQHQLGTTVDLSIRRYHWKFSQSQARSTEGRWLGKNAHRYGFVLSYPRGQRQLTGYIHEPWHFRYIGVKAATEMHNRKMPLEAFLRDCRTCDSDLLCES